MKKRKWKSKTTKPLPRPVREIKHVLEAALICLLCGMFYILPPQTASNFGGALGRGIGKMVGVSGRIRRQLDESLPEKSAAEKKEILRQMWDNLGRVAAEYTHLEKFLKHPEWVTIEGFEHIEKARAQGRPVIMLSGHYANWEIGVMICAMRGVPLASVYRTPNNPYVDKMLRRLRRPLTSELFPKGREGALGMMRALREGRSIGLLVDQRMNEGIDVPFFGKPALTVDAPAQMALKTNAAMLPVLMTRLGPCRFHMTVLPELTSDETKPFEDRVYELAAQMNLALENHIRNYPGQWLWLHRRWRYPELDETETENKS
jgi:KDO2-lipid IV(A) lauroyltransferase